MGKKLFNFVIGNPPYQEQNDKNVRQPPVYNTFMDAADKVSEVTELITPARFLFNAGQTPKSWNEKKLNDPHFKVLKYESDASKVFPDTEIKGGVAVTLRDSKRTFTPIKIFTESESMNSILQKVLNAGEPSLSDICVGAVPYHFTEAVRSDHPEFMKDIPDSFDLRTNVLDKLSGELFFERPRDKNYVEIFGLHNRSRSFMWIDEKYITKASNFNGYKVLKLPTSKVGLHIENSIV